MSTLPRISGKEVCKIFRKIGYETDHQTGSHVILRQQKPPFRRLTVPNHKEIAIGTVRSLIHQAGLTLHEFRDLMNRD